MFHPLLYSFYSFANFLILTHINMSHVSWVLIFGSSLTHVSSQARRVSFEWTRIKCPYHLCRSPAIRKSQRSCSRDWNIWDQEKWNPHEFSSLSRRFLGTFGATLVAKRGTRQPTQSASIPKTASEVPLYRVSHLSDIVPTCSIFWISHMCHGQNMVKGCNGFINFQRISHTPNKKKHPHFMVPLMYIASVLNHGLWGCCIGGRD